MEDTSRGTLGQRDPVDGRGSADGFQVLTSQASGSAPMTGGGVVLLVSAVIGSGRGCGVHVSRRDVRVVGDFR